MVHPVETGLRSDLMRTGAASCSEGEMTVARFKPLDNLWPTLPNDGPTVGRHAPVGDPR
jgi:hypothetical protein